MRTGPYGVTGERELPHHRADQEDEREHGHELDACLAALWLGYEGMPRHTTTVPRRELRLKTAALQPCDSRHRSADAAVLHPDPVEAVRAEAEERDPGHRSDAAGVEHAAGGAKGEEGQSDRAVEHQPLTLGERVELEPVLAVEPIPVERRSGDERDPQKGQHKAHDPAASRQCREGERDERDDRELAGHLHATEATGASDSGDETR